MSKNNDSPFTIHHSQKPRTNIPEFLRRHIPNGSAQPVRELIKDLGLNTVCLEARCPNLQECYSKKTATFLIAGNVCTRNCSFCSVESGKPNPLEADEPERVAEASSRMNLSHVVITSVTRDDLEDGGARHFAETIAAIRKRMPDVSIEVLTPDFQGKEELIQIVCEAKPDVFNHNIETVKRLTPIVRFHSNYDRSLKVLKWVSDHYSDIKVKSGVMVGLGETEDEALETLQDLREAGVQMITIGQYLKPDPKCRPVEEYISTEKFRFYEDKAKEIGFLEVASGSFVRSSYNACESFRKVSI
jgi:lipoic acid synthetase